MWLVSQLVGVLFFITLLKNAGIDLSSIPVSYSDALQHTVASGSQ